MTAALADLQSLLARYAGGEYVTAILDADILSSSWKRGGRCYAEAIASVATDGVGQDAAPMLTPLWREIPADLETPVSAYLKLARGRYGFLLESVEGGERLARYSFVGTDPYMVLRVRDGVAERRWLSGPRAGTTESRGMRRPVARDSGGAGAASASSDSLACRVSPVARSAIWRTRWRRATSRASPFPTRIPMDTPDAVFLFSDTLLIFDHVRQRALLLTHADLDATSGDEALARAEAEARLDEMERRLHAPTTTSATRPDATPAQPECDVRAARGT